MSFWRRASGSVVKAYSFGCRRARYPSHRLQGASVLRAASSSLAGSLPSVPTNVNLLAGEDETGASDAVVAEAERAVHDQERDSREDFRAFWDHPTPGPGSGANGVRRHHGDVGG